MALLGRILVVDDEEPVREVLTEYFGAQGYAVEAVASGTDALAAVRRVRPDLVLLLTIAADLGDLAATERATMEAAVATARRSASPTR